MALLSASAKVEDSAAAFTFTATWSTLTPDQFSGGSGRHIKPNLNDGIESAEGCLWDEFGEHTFSLSFGQGVVSLATSCPIVAIATG